MVGTEITPCMSEAHEEERLRGLQHPALTTDATRMRGGMVDMATRRTTPLLYSSTQEVIIMHTNPLECRSKVLETGGSFLENRQRRKVVGIRGKGDNGGGEGIKGKET
jgi:hypothetical protein